MSVAVPTINEDELPIYIAEVKEQAKKNGLETFNDIDRFKEEEVPDILANYSEVDFVGIGIEVLVVGDPTNPNRVISYEYRGYERDPYYFLEIYQAHKILNILYPSHFPRIYGVDHNQAMTVRQRVKFDEPKENIDLFKYDGYPERLEKYIAETSGLKIHLDYNANNFLKDRNGKYKYVDLVEVDENTARLLDAEKALAYFDKKFENKLHTEQAQIQRERLLVAIKRLKEIDESKKRKREVNHNY